LVGFFFETILAFLGYINMQIIDKTLGTKSISISPRSDNYTSITIYNELTNSIVDLDNISITNNAYYKTLSFDIAEDLQDQHFYYLTMYNGSNVIYRDKIFVTSQQPEVYTINKDVYTSHTSNNEFITL
jgi:hypothetical protein